MPFLSGRCYSTAKLVNKTAVITGANSGIGKETALDFYKRVELEVLRRYHEVQKSNFGQCHPFRAYVEYSESEEDGTIRSYIFGIHGARVIMACRDLDKAAEAKSEIEEKCKDIPDIPETGKLIIVKCDLASLKSVRECAQTILDTEAHVNILVNNAGVMMCPKSYTEDGFEMQIGTNHMAHFLLTMLLLPRMRTSTPARIVTVSSRVHSMYDMNFDDLNYKKRSYSSTEAYSQSKLANALFSRELASKLKEHNIRGINTYTLHPGVIRTELGRHLNNKLSPCVRWLGGIFIVPFLKTPELGAQTTIYCSVDEKCAGETGLYYSDCVVIRPSQKALNDEVAKQLWDVSMDLVGLQDYDPFSADDPALKE